MKKALVQKMFSLILSLMLVFSLWAVGAPAYPQPAETDEEALNIEDLSLFGEQSVSSLVYSSLSADQQKLGGDLLQLVNSDFLPAGKSRSDLLKDMEKLHQLSGGVSKRKLASANDVYVYIKLAPGYNLEDFHSVISRLVSEDRENCLLAAWVPIDQLETLASMVDVLSVKSVVPPLAKSGSVTSQGDYVHRADLVRAQGIDGSGIKIGVISDGANHWTSARDSGDLPEDVTILEDDLPWGGEEGTALMEIIYDLAPGAKLYFHDCGTNILEFNQAIDNLAAAGCTIICDDITWTDEPFFEDGVIASHVKDLLSANQIVFVSSAGNYGLNHYQKMFKWAYKDGSFWHNFGRGHTRIKNMKIQIPAGGVAWIVLEWNEPFGRAKCNYDLYLLDPVSGEPLAASEGVQNGDQDPYEFIGVANDGGEPAEVLLAIKAGNRQALFKPRILEAYIYGANAEEEYITPEDSIFGHPAVPEVVSCGAVACDTPDEIEAFSSRGPSTMLHDVRPKPDLCGADRIDVSGAGGFYSPFYGTSASAPHAAAVAALLWSKSPDLSAVEVRYKLLESAVDLGSRGRDNTYGYGRVDALNACCDELTIDSLTADQESPQPCDTVIRWTCTARGAGTLTYSWQVYRDHRKIMETGFSGDNYFDWTPNKKGRYQIRVNVKDESGQSAYAKSKYFVIL